MVRCDLRNRQIDLGGKVKRMLKFTAGAIRNSLCNALLGFVLPASLLAVASSVLSMATDDPLASASMHLLRSNTAMPAKNSAAARLRPAKRPSLRFEQLELRQLFSVAPITALPLLEQPTLDIILPDSDPGPITLDDPPPLASNWTPLVFAGRDSTIGVADVASLQGEVIANYADDPVVTWSVLSGPGIVTFGDANSPITTAGFSTAGTYELALTVTDHGITAGDRVVVTVDPLQQDVPENLVEMFSRKARRSTATWGAEYLEDPSTYVWQAETFMYHDVTTGHEVWKVSDTPGLQTYYHEDIGVSPWSADGSKLAITGWDRYTQAYSQSLQSDFRYIWMTADTDGDALRPTVEASRRIGGRGYFHWDPQTPNQWYEIGEAHLASGGQSNVLYRSAVDDQGVVTSEAILTLPPGAAGAKINKLLSADGRRIVLEQSDRFWPISILPDGSAVLDDTDGYSIDRNFGLYGGMNGGTVSSFHDQYIAGTGQDFLVMPNDPGSTATWWRLDTIGSAPDGGPLYTGNNGSDDFGEVSPESYSYVRAGNLPSPFVTPDRYTSSTTSYWSHFVPDRWGRNALFSNVSSGLPGGSYDETVGPGVWDYENHQWTVPSFGGGAQHHAWNGFTDWVVSSGGPSDPTGRAAQLLLAGDINDPTSQIVVNNTYSRYDGGTAYNSLARPGQSPDGTKVAWHSEFLNARDNVDVYWSVVYKPYPPTDLAAASGAGVDLEFLPPTYTDRRWIDPATGKIDEVNGETLYAREIEQYQIWRSDSPTNGWTTVGSVAAEYDNDLTTNTLRPVVNGDWVSAANKLSFADAPGDGTWYYAITSREHSGLESDELSAVLEVTVESGVVTSSQIVQEQGQTDFWTQAPSAPGGLNVQAQSVAGHNLLTWNATADPMVRLYHIYYSADGQPAAHQSQRVASVAADSSHYLDWLADPASGGTYGITAVDWYGNESAMAVQSTAVAASAVSASTQVGTVQAEPVAFVAAGAAYWTQTTATLASADDAATPIVATTASTDVAADSVVESVDSDQSLDDNDARTLAFQQLAPPPTAGAVRRTTRRSFRESAFSRVEADSLWRETVDVAFGDGSYRPRQRGEAL